MITGGAFTTVPVPPVSKPTIEDFGLNDSKALGYYADGWFDRRRILNVDGNDCTTMQMDNGTTGYWCQLLVNSGNKSIAFPIAGYLVPPGYTSFSYLGVISHIRAKDLIWTGTPSVPTIYLANYGGASFSAGYQLGKAVATTHRCVKQ